MGENIVHKTLLSIIIGYFIAICSFFENVADKYFVDKISVANDITIVLKDRSFDVKIHIKYPDSVPVRGAILALHGWNLPALDWCEKTTLCQKAKQNGYIVILPEMGKSTYQNEFYKETRTNYRRTPTRKWLVDTAFTYLADSLNLLKPSQQNFVLGLSTGARGAALLALDCPEIFVAMASLSGDCDQTLMPTESIYIGFYGQMKQFPERWSGTDNILNRVAELKVPTYLGHGAADKVSPPEQTVLLYNEIKAKCPQLKCKLHIDSLAKHNYKYWDSEVDAVLRFFNSTK